MKVLSFSKGGDIPVGLAGCDEIALAIGPDSLPRIAVHRGKEVWYARQKANGSWYCALVAKASTDGGANSVPVVDCYAISIASGLHADVVGWRNRTKGGPESMQKWHGPGICVIPVNGTPGPAQFKGFTTGACKVIFDDPSRPYAVEAWSKNGAWMAYDVRNAVDSPALGGGVDPIGLTGEKLVVAAGGWRGMGGAPNMDPSAVIQRGGSKTAVLDGNAYPEIGDDMLWPGMGVIPYAIPRVYFCAVINGRMLVNRVKAGKVAFNPPALPSIGPASHTPRHNPALVPSKWRCAALWTFKGNIYAVDVDGAVAGVSVPFALCGGERAAAAKLGANIAVAVLRGGQVYFAKVTTRKG